MWREGHVDDLAATRARDHRPGGDGVAHQPSALDVQAHHRPEALRRDVLGGGHVLPAGVVHEQVDLAVLLEHLVHERSDLVLLADVAGMGPHTTPVARGGGLLERLGPAPAHHHARPERRQLERAGAPQPGAATADDRHLPVEQSWLEELRGHRRASVTSDLS
jgi:hypothetical protein